MEAPTNDFDHLFFLMLESCLTVVFFTDLSLVSSSSPGQNQFSFAFSMNSCEPICKEATGVGLGWQLCTEFPRIKGPDVSGSHLQYSD